MIEVVFKNGSRLVTDVSVSKFKFNPDVLKIKTDLKILPNLSYDLLCTKFLDIEL